jgi:hypothetical protein
VNAEATAATAADPADPAQALPPEAAQPGLGDALRMLWDDARGALTDRVRLALLELRLAGVTLVQLVIYAVVVAVLVVTAWLALVGGLVVGFMSAGVHWAVALAGAVVVNLAVAAALVLSMLRMVERIGLPASLRRFGKQAKPAAADQASPEGH